MLFKASPFWSSSELLLAYPRRAGALRLWLTLLSATSLPEGLAALPLLWFQTGLDFVARSGARLQDGPHRRRLLALSLSSNLPLLGFGHFRFGVESALDSRTRSASAQVTLSILLPVGISFYVQA